MRPFPQVDIVHDLNVIPWPLPDQCTTRIYASHLIEHIPAVVVDTNGTRFPFIDFMNEAWRVMKPGGELLISMPYGYSPGFIQDPTHCNPCNEVTWAYFDPLHHLGFTRFYEPKPWYYRYISYTVMWNMEVLMLRHSEDPEKWRAERKAWGPMELKKGAEGDK